MRLSRPAPILTTVAVAAHAFLASLLWSPPAEAAQRCGGKRATQVGTAGSDELYGTPERDVIVGRGGSDLILGGAGNDILCGDAGKDSIAGHGGDDALYGGGKYDVLLGFNGDDRLIGGPGFDQGAYYFADGVRASLPDRVARGEGRDKLSGIEDLWGSPKRDVLIGNAEQNFLFGGGGNDRLVAGAADDALLGMNGDDFLDGGGGKDNASFYLGNPGVTASLTTMRAHGQGSDRFTDVEALEGTATGDDRLTGNAKANRFFSSGGDDKIFGLDGADVAILYVNDGAAEAYGGPGADILGTFDETDSLYGGDGADQVEGRLAYGGEGNDRLWGRSRFADPPVELRGQEGSDVLIPLKTTSVPSGGPGDDFFIDGGGSSTYRPEPGDDAITFQRSDTRVRVDLPQEKISGHGPDQIILEGAVWPAELLGTKKNDVFIGSGVRNVFGGLKGDDDFQGGAGDDVLRGGDGQDTADGGDGIDQCPGVEQPLFCEGPLPEPQATPSLVPAPDAPLRSGVDAFADGGRNLRARTLVRELTFAARALRGL